MAFTATPDNVMTLEKAKSGAIPPNDAQVIVEDIIKGSTIMRLGKFIEMKDKNGNPVQEKEFHFLAKGPGAYWVGEGEKIQTSKAEYRKAKIVTKKIGVILPVSREFLYYSRKRFFEEMRPLVSEAFQTLFDEAGILGQANPFSQSIESVSDAGKVTKSIDFDSILELEDKLYDTGIEPNAFISTVKNHSILRKATKTENGVAEYLYDRANQTLDGKPIANLKSKAMKKGTIYTGDFDYLFYGIPYTMSYKISEEAQLSTVKNEDDSAINLFEQELIAARFTMDVAFLIAKEAFAKLEAPEA